MELFAVEARAVLSEMQQARNPLNILILDACRDNPLPSADKSTGSKGLARMDAPSGSVIAFATAPGKTASDNTVGRNGLYAKHLISAINTPGLRLEDVFKRVGAAVEKESAQQGGDQSPEEVMKLRSEQPFYFKSGNAEQLASAKPESVMPTARPVQASGLSLEDLQKEEESRRAWSKWQGQMKTDYNKTAAFKGSADLQVTAWERFLVAWEQDNPFSREDNALRTQATARQQKAFEQSALQARPLRPTSPNLSQGISSCTECPEMVVIPAGSFEMGSLDGIDDEKPLHRVDIRSFLMSKTEVTQGQWKAVMGSNPSSFSSCGDNCPVEQVSWNDIQQYIQKLNAMSGQQYRLPSEAEWEYAARAGSMTKYSWGDGIGKGNANCDGCGSEWDEKTTAPVGSFKPNAFGLHDMHGNVWEWVQDWYRYSYGGAPLDGSAWENGGDQYYRVLRGGGWNSNPTGLQSNIRGRDAPGGRFAVNGFRLAGTVK